jgi:hypothetical protein
LPDPNNNNTGIESSFLTKPVAIICWLVLCVFAALFEKTGVALFLGFVFVLTFVSYLWARAALKNVDFLRHANHTGVFPGQTFVVARTIANGKALPLIWVEIREPCGTDEPASSPPETIISHEVYDEAKETTITTYERLYTLSLVHWYGRVTFHDTWTARRRGIMEFGDSSVRSGDGFGLSAVGRTYKTPEQNRIVVFPALADVSVAGIINDMWDTRSRETGYLEDRTSIKSVRDYQAGDPMRNINMRLLARGQAIKTNVFEIVTPDSVLFVIDPGSFRLVSPYVFEEALSVTASLIESLTRRGISVSLFAPSSVWYEETCTPPSCADAERFEMLTLLAAASEKDGPIRGVPPDWTEETGKIYYVASDAGSVTASALLGLLPEHKTRILTPDDLNAYRCIGKDRKAV